MHTTLQFLGAAQTVTGSKHLLTHGDRRFLIDCGLFQGSPELKKRNWAHLPLDVRSIEAVIITHAHIDHIGYLPRLYKSGYRGPIYCTGATSEITRLSLPDSAHLQEEYARYANKKGFSRHKPALPLYTSKEADETCKLIEPKRFDQRNDLGGGCSYRFLRAGHILGSAFVEFTLPGGKTLLFSGDLGRPNQPIIRDPEIVEAADYLLIESTYGDRVHPNQPPIEFLCDAAARIVETKGVIVIPSFAIGRTQDVLYYLYQLEEAGECPQLPVYVDSPMAIDATGIYSRHKEDHDLDMQAFASQGKNPLRPPNVTFVRNQQESKRLNSLTGPAIIISASGMASGGRVVHHLARRLPHKENIVLFVGYQAEGTLGRKLWEGAKEVAIMGEKVSVAAEVRSLGSLSAHADSQEILQWLSSFTRAPKRTFIVHGEPNAQEVLASKIRERFGWDAVIPQYEQIEEI